MDLASQVRRAEAELEGTRLVFETGLLAKQAGGAVTVTHGETVVLVTATMADSPREGIDFFPLTCDFEERMYAAGKIPGGFFKREGRPGERAILTSRLIDRPLRPLFPKGMRNDVQIVATVLSTDQEHDPGVAAVNGASCALLISGIPWDGPVGAARVGLIEGQLVVNPTMRVLGEKSQLDLVVAATESAIVMVEAGATEVPEAQILQAIDLAHAEIKKLIGAQRQLAAAVPTVAGWRLAGLPTAFGRQEVARLLASCDRRRTFGRRDFAGLGLLTRLGLRAGEVAALELPDIDWRRGEVVIRGKGRRQERLPLPVDVGEAIVGWLRKGRPHCECTKVFTRVRAPHRGLTSGGVSAIVRAACARAGLPEVNAHRLRHTAATEMLRAGAGLAEVGQVLRHASLLTTSIYAKVDRTALRSLAQPWPGSAS